jgi:hypothetical protein
MLKGWTGKAAAVGCLTAWVAALTVTRVMLVTSGIPAVMAGAIAAGRDKGVALGGV